jgi:hypothetical protein
MPDDKKPPFTVKLPFVGEFQLERWAAHCMSAIAVVGVLSAVLVHMVPEWRAVVSPAEAEAQLAADNAEYQVHAFEAPEHEYTLFDDETRGKLAIRTFADGCLLVRRQAKNASITKLVRDLASSFTVPKTAAFPAFEATLSAQGGGCPFHPPPFQWKEEQTNTPCITRYWRHYLDGCEHFQFHNVCSGAWDTNADGSPRVQWTRCNHR